MVNASGCTLLCEDAEEDEVVLTDLVDVFEDVIEGMLGCVRGW